MEEMKSFPFRDLFHHLKQEFHGHRRFEICEGEQNRRRFLARIRAGGERKRRSVTSAGLNRRNPLRNKEEIEISSGKKKEAQVFSTKKQK